MCFMARIQIRKAEIRVPQRKQFPRIRISDRANLQWIFVEVKLEESIEN